MALGERVTEAAGQRPQLCELLLSKNSVAQIKYFTAIGERKAERPDQQPGNGSKLYLPRCEPSRAFQYNLGSFPESSGYDAARYAHRSVSGIKTEEKGSDVNSAPSFGDHFLGMT
jgi:hypothetical protein